MAAARQAVDHVAAHAAEANEAELHLPGFSLRVLSSVSLMSQRVRGVLMLAGWAVGQPERLIVEIEDRGDDGGAGLFGRIVGMNVTADAVGVVVVVAQACLQVAEA